MTRFSFEHVFRAPSPEAVFAAYFDPDHQAEQDREVDIVEREELERTDDGETLCRVCRCVPRRQLPPVVRPFVTGPLHYIETTRWHRRDHRIEVQIRPSLLPGRVEIRADYRLETVEPGKIRRRYEGEVSVNIALLAARIERGIVQELGKSIPLAASCTQIWLDRHYVSARA